MSMSNGHFSVVYLLSFLFSLAIVYGDPEIPKNQQKKPVSNVKYPYELKGLPNDVNCREMEAEADQSFKRILMIGENLRIPRNQSQLIEHCKLAKPALKLANNYGKCLTAFPRQVLRILIRGAKKSLREYCDSGKGREQILKHLTCLTEENAQIFYAALERGLQRIDFVSREISDIDLVSTLCCTFHLLYGNLMLEVRQQCGNASEDAIKFIKPIVDSIAGDVLELGCSKWHSLDTCDQQIPLIMNQLRHVQLRNSTELKDRFIIGPVITIASRLVS